MLGSRELERTLFPVGDSTKREVRAEAARLDLPVADKPDSMEVCFVPRGDAAAFVEREAPPASRRPGPIVDGAGAVLGRHEGVHRFTVGQRRGLQLGGGPARYVRRIDAAAGTIVVATSSDLACKGLIAEDVRWNGFGAPSPEQRLAVRIRHRHAAIPCSVTAVDRGRARIAFEEPGPLVTPGQAAVVYDGDYVLGGGWIAGELT